MKTINVRFHFNAMKTGAIIATLFLLLCSSNAGAQAIAIYKSSNGMTVYMTMTGDGIVIKQNNDVIAFQMTYADANGFCFSNPQHGMVVISSDQTSMSVITGNPPVTYVLSLQGYVNNSTPSYPSGVGGSSGSGTGSSGKVGTVCKSCNGSGKCGTCKGSGTYMGSYGTGLLACPNCSASNGRICSVCNGTGKW